MCNHARGIFNLKIHTDYLHKELLKSKIHRKGKTVRDIDPDSLLVYADTASLKSTE